MQIALKKTKLKTFYVVGFDGYQENSINKILGKFFMKMKKKCSKFFWMKK